MIPAGFDYEVAESVDHADRAAREERGREAPGGRALAPPSHEAADCAAGAPRRHRAAGRALLRQGGRRHDRDRRAHEAQGRRGLAGASGALRDRLSHGRPGRRPAGPPPRHDRGLARARRSRLRPPDCDPRAARRARGARAGRRPGDSGSGLLHRVSGKRRSSRPRCSWRSASPSPEPQAGRTRRWHAVPRTGRRWPWPRSSTATARSSVRRSRSRTWGRPRCGRPPRRRRSSAGRRSRTPRGSLRTERSRPTDHAASSEFRKHLARVLTRRALEEARSR